MRNYYATIDYTCAGCGAEAVSVSSLGGYGTRVMVPHAPGCPVKAQIVDAHARAQAKTGGRS